MTSTELDDFTNQTGVYADKKSLKGAARRAKERAAETLHTRIDPLAENARLYADKARTQLMNASRMATDRAKEHPGVSALVLLGLGIAVGAILATTLRRPAIELGGTLRTAGQRWGTRLRH